MTRADQRLVELGLSPSRARAQAEIRAGSVTCDGRVVSKPSEEIGEGATLTIAAPANPYVSRGALKLSAALDHFGLDVAGKTCLDVGASTGGFTNVLLWRGAAKVYALDVGHDQLHERLRADPRVIVREGINARELSPEIVPEPVDVIVADVSFISLKLALPPALALAAPGALLVALIKPQFEAGKDRVKKGVVRDESIHAEVCDEIAAFVGAQAGWQVIGVTPSPITGPEGNKEFLIAARKG